MIVLLDIDDQKMMDLMKSFYTLTHIRIAIVDIGCHEVMGYPEHFTDFCTYMRANPGSCQNCIDSDFNGFEQCRKTGKIYIYKCHAGLTEAAYPLKENETIIGYIMFGQITDMNDKRMLTSQVLSQCAGYGVDQTKLRKAIRKLAYKSHDELIAAAMFFETCIQYILHRQLISARGEQIVLKLNRYIDEHMAQTITVDDLTKNLLISRTQLYNLTRQYLGIGIAEYVRNMRMNKAKSYLSEGTYSLVEICDLTGFNDYHYFRRIFKKYEKMTPREYQKQVQKTP